jgi:hypothetical protein
MKQLFLALSIITFIFSCSPNKEPEETNSKKNKEKIAKLERSLSTLKAELEVQKALNNQAEIAKLRAEIKILFHKLERSVDLRLDSLDNKLEHYKSRLDAIENNFVSIEQFQILTKTVEKELNKKRELIAVQIEGNQDTQEVLNLARRIIKIEDEYKSFKRETKQYLIKAQRSWDQKFDDAIIKSQGNITSRLKMILTNEISRVHILQEDLRAQMANLQSETNNEVNEIKNQIKEVNKEIKGYDIRLKNLSKKMDNSSNTGLVVDIIKKLYEPCTKSLADDKYCYTSATIIQKLGGDFIDPIGFKKTRKDLLSYLSLTGVDSKAATNNIDAYIVSEHPIYFNACFPNETHMIAPQKYWPRLAILTLVFQKIEADMLKQKELGLVSTDVKPMQSFSSWYRNQCYHNELKCEQNLNNCGKNHRSDHLFGASLDGSFKNEVNISTFNYYKEFIEKRILESDVFSIVHPLMTSGLTMSVGFGKGSGAHGKGKLHLGIMSEIKARNGNVRRWNY